MAPAAQTTPNRPLSSDLGDPDHVPYFLWDDPMTVAELRRRLTSASRPECTRLLAKILREARDTEVWSFTTPEEVRERWVAVDPPDEILANKLCTLLSRAELRDLVDVRALERAGTRWRPHSLPRRARTPG